MVRVLAGAARGPFQAVMDREKIGLPGNIALFDGQRQAVFLYAAT